MATGRHQNRPSLSFNLTEWLTPADFVTAVEQPAPIQAPQHGGDRSRVLALPTVQVKGTTGGGAVGATSRVA